MKGRLKNLLKIFCMAVIPIIGLAFAPYLLPRSYLFILQSIIMWTGLSISWYFFSSLTKYISLGSVAFVGTGLYFTAVYMSYAYKGYYPFLPFPVVVVLAGLICFVLALAIGSVTLRLRGIYFAVASFGIGEVVGGFIRWWQAREHVYIIYRPPGYADFKIHYYSILITAVAVFLLITLMLRSKFGLALRMIGECEEAAAHTGVNTAVYKVLGFAFSALCMGLVGGAYMISFGSVNVNDAFKADYSILPPVMVLLGGAGTVYGPIVGAPTLTLIDEYLRRITTNYPLFYGLILLIIVVFMPQGIMGALGKLKSTKLFRGKFVKPMP